MTLPAIAAFEERYAEHSDLTLQELHGLGLFGWPCDCGLDGCEGYQMLSLHDRLVAAGWSPPVPRGQDRAESQD